MRLAGFVPVDNGRGGAGRVHDGILRGSRGTQRMRYSTATVTFAIRCSTTHHATQHAYLLPHRRRL
jgi:hypothetical protein